MMRVPDAASIGTLWWLEAVLGRKCGGSTGTNLFGSLQLAAEMIRLGKSGSIVTMICDPGDRYLDTYYDPAWLQEQAIDAVPWVEALERFARTGAIDGPAAVARA